MARLSWARLGWTGLGVGRKPGLSAGRIVGRGASVVFPSVTVTPDNCPGDATPFTLLPPPSCSFPLPHCRPCPTLPYSLPCSTSVTPPPSPSTLPLLLPLSCSSVLSVPSFPPSCPACSTSVTPSTPLVRSLPSAPFPHHGSHFYL